MGIIKKLSNKIINKSGPSNPWGELFSTKRKGFEDIDFENKKVYCIAFTPRSGSSWLSEELKLTNRFGNPREWFNTDFPGLQKRIELYKCNSIEQYYKAIKRELISRNGVYGMEITWFQSARVFEYVGHRDQFDDIKYWFWLRRRDFVAQAISLFKAVESGKFHSVDKSVAKPVEYNGESIKNWVLHILEQEYHFNIFFKEKNLEPLEIWYEDMMNKKRFTINSMFRFLGMTKPNKKQLKLDSGFEKISDETSIKFQEQFEKEYPDFVSYWSQNRGIISAFEYKEG